MTTERVARSFAGANLFQSGLARFCLPEVVLKRSGVRRTCG